MGPNAVRSPADVLSLDLLGLPDRALTKGDVLDCNFHFSRRIHSLNGRSLGEERPHITDLGSGQLKLVKFSMIETVLRKAA